MRAAAISDATSDFGVPADALDLLLWLAAAELDGVRLKAYTDRLLRLNVDENAPAAFRVYVVQAAAALLNGDGDAGLRRLSEAEKHASLADLDTFARYLTTKSLAQSCVGDFSTAISGIALALDIARKRTDRYALWQHLLWLSLVLAAQGKLSRAMEALLEAIELAIELQLTWKVPLSQTECALIAFELGQVAKATSLLQSAFEAPCTSRGVIVSRSTIGMRVALASGDGELLRRAFDRRVIDYALQSGIPKVIVPAITMYSEYLRRAGRDGTGLPRPDIPEGTLVKDTLVSMSYGRRTATARRSRQCRVFLRAALRMIRSSRPTVTFSKHCRRKSAATAHPPK